MSEIRAYPLYRDPAGTHQLGDLAEVNPKGLSLILIQYKLYPKKTMKLHNLQELRVCLHLVSKQ